MQKVTREILLAKAAELLNAGTVNRVLGWKAGEFTYDVTPALFQTAAELEKDFVYGPFCGANFSKYLVKETRKDEGKVLVFLKPCDTYSFNQLLTEHRFDREKVYAVGIPCDGMADIQLIKEQTGDGITGVECDGDNLIVHTLYDGDKTLALADCLAERCANCKSKKHVADDELLGEDGEVIDSHRFDEVEKLEKMTEDERFAFWQNELSRCIRCNACRNVCPSCQCYDIKDYNTGNGVQRYRCWDSCMYSDFTMMAHGNNRNSQMQRFRQRFMHKLAYFPANNDGMFSCVGCGRCVDKCHSHLNIVKVIKAFGKEEK